jgi:hypothetical protein
MNPLRNAFKKKEPTEQEIVILYFMKQYLFNPNITIDLAILKFEKANTCSLQKFAEDKNRTVDSYYATYLDLFQTAQNNVKKEQLIIEKRFKKTSLLERHRKRLFARNYIPI